jgi:hypothetical protein
VSPIWCRLTSGIAKSLANNPWPVRVHREVCAIEPLDLPAAAGDQREALDVEPHTQPVRLRQRAELLGRTPFEGWLSASRMLRHRIAKRRRGQERGACQTSRQRSLERK